MFIANRGSKGAPIIGSTRVASVVPVLRVELALASIHLNGSLIKHAGMSMKNCNLNCSTFFVFSSFTSPACKSCHFHVQLVQRLHLSKVDAYVVVTTECFCGLVYRIKSRVDACLQQS